MAVRSPIPLELPVITAIFWSGMVSAKSLILPTRAEMAPFRLDGLLFVP